MLNLMKNIKNPPDIYINASYMLSIKSGQGVRYTREDLPLHPPIRRIFSLKSK